MTQSSRYGEKSNSVAAVWCLEHKCHYMTGILMSCTEKGSWAGLCRIDLPLSWFIGHITISSDALEASTVMMVPPSWWPWQRSACMHQLVEFLREAAFLLELHWGRDMSRRHLSHFLLRIFSLYSYSVRYPRFALSRALLPPALPPAPAPVTFLTEDLICLWRSYSLADEFTTCLR